MARPQEDYQTAADKQALKELHLRALLRELRRRPPKFDRTTEPWTLRVGDDCVWLWRSSTSYESTPVRAIVLGIKDGKAQIRAEFVTGPVILWVDVDRLRPVKRSRRN